MLLRFISAVVVAGAALLLLGGFYFSGELREGALEPATATDPVYDLEITKVTADSVAIVAAVSSGQIGELGVEGIAWDGGYLQATEFVSSSEGDSGLRTDLRITDSDGTVPPVGTAVRLDLFAYPGDPQQAFGIPFETVIYTSDVGSFPAWFIPGGSDTWAIIVHGKGADLREALRIVPTLHALDFPILVIHYRNDPGVARDPSGYHRFGETEWIDLAAAVRYAEENGATQHLLVGYSMGGAIVTSYLTQSPLRNRTRGAILDSPALSFEAIVDFQAAQTEIPFTSMKLPGVVTALAKQISSWRFDIDWAATDYLAKSNELHTPMLIFHGTGDTSVPYETSAEMARLRPDIVTLVTTEADHTRSWNESPDDYRHAIIEFLATHRG